MKRAILAATICLVLAPSAANALDWALNSTLSETVELSDNTFLATIPKGTLSSYSTVNVNAVALTPTSRFTFDGDESYRKYWGPGVDFPNASTESISGDVRAHYETFGKVSGDRSYINGSLTSASSAFALLGQLGVVTNARGYLQTSHLDGGIDRWVTVNDFLSVQGGSTYTSFDPGTGGTPFTDSNASGSWRHRWDSILTLTASSGYEELDFANVQQSQAKIFRENAGFEATFSPLLSFRGTWGVAFVQSKNGSAATSFGGNGSGGSAAGFITDMLLTYKLFPDTTLTLAGNQSISPTVVGSLIESSSLRGGFSYTINSRSSLSGAAEAVRSISGGIEADYASASLAYSYQLTHEWTAQFSYRFLHRFASPTPGGVNFDPVTGFPLVSGTGVASSNTITLVVSKNITLLPNGY